MFSIETQHFYALYLLSHGALKLAMVLLLARVASLGLSGGDGGAGGLRHLPAGPLVA